jgi:hypothetical protein
MEFLCLIVNGVPHAWMLEASLRIGWVPDPVLMPSGRPNVVEGVGAIYHLVKGSESEVREYALRADPRAVAAYVEAQIKAGQEAASPSGEFDGVSGTLSLPHGVDPPPDSAWRVFKVYEKAVIWLRVDEKEAA